MENYMKLEFLSKSKNESFSRVVVAAFASQLDPTLEELSDIKTAVSEAVTNAIIHGYEYGEGLITIEASIRENEIEIIVKDSGKGIENIEEAMEPFYTSKPNLERSGMGFTVMETFMDSLVVESKKGEGTVVKMTKQIKKVSDKER
ncbi:MAG: anti-sigma F factor [Tissierellia bacterium]|nr:anti-sigma F factor [Tissierellia bacterium]